ncbi:MAG TPA: SCP2 sterol-binding domain-containing protein [Anaeromyxobacteraceae bacterium]|jgi:putative sterol carrier protein
MAEAANVKDVFERHMPERLKSKPDLVTKINAVYQFNISGPGGGQWAVDCATPGGAVTQGTVETARCTVACADADFLNIVNGKLNAQMAFMMGKLKIQGDMGMALKLAQLLG